MNDSISSLEARYITSLLVNIAAKNNSRLERYEQYASELAHVNDDANALQRIFEDGILRFSCTEKIKDYEKMLSSNYTDVEFSRNFYMTREKCTSKFKEKTKELEDINQRLDALEKSHGLFYSFVEKCADLDELDALKTQKKRADEYIRALERDYKVAERNLVETEKRIEQQREAKKRRIEEYAEACRTLGREPTPEPEPAPPTPAEAK